MYRSIAAVPPGSQDLLADDVRRRRRVQAAWFSLAEQFGYAEVVPPTFEYEEVFTRGAGPELAERLIRFVDRDGRTVALRADFTSAVARIAATKLRDAALPLRLCYAGKVYRQEAEGGARRRETFQLGAELIGDPSPRADAEILQLAIHVLHDLGIRDFQINVGDVRFVRPLLDQLSPQSAERLREAIDRKDRATLAAHALEAGTSQASQRLLAQLPTLIGRSAVLLRAATVAADSEADEAIRSLQDCDALLTEEERAHVVYDLGEVRGLGYYTGAQWEVFVAGIGRAVGFGGRYDGLLGLYGADRPAVGFALETDALADALAA